MQVADAKVASIGVQEDTTGGLEGTRRMIRRSALFSDTDLTRHLINSPNGFGGLDDFMDNVNTKDDKVCTDLQLIMNHGVAPNTSITNTSSRRITSPQLTSSSRMR